MSENYLPPSFRLPSPPAKEKDILDYLRKLIFELENMYTKIANTNNINRDGRNDV